MRESTWEFPRQCYVEKNKKKIVENQTFINAEKKKLLRQTPGDQVEDKEGRERLHGKKCKSQALTNNV